MTSFYRGKLLRTAGKTFDKENEIRQPDQGVNKRLNFGP